MSIDKFKIYKTPKTFTQEELWKCFKSGAYIAYELEDSEKKIFNVYGYASSDIYDEDYISADDLFALRRKLANDEVSISHVEPAPRTSAIHPFKTTEGSKESIFILNDAVNFFHTRAKSVYSVNDTFLVIASTPYYTYSVLLALTIDKNLDTTKYEEMWDGYDLYIKSFETLKLECISSKPDKVGILLAGSSGTGKTETFRALKKYFKSTLPFLGFIQYDATGLTATGYRGSDVSYILKEIKKANEGGFCIVFIDEMDKKLCHEIGSSGFDYNAALQSEFLTLLEGGNSEYDTSNTLFILSGFFDAIRQKRTLKRSEVGFGGATPDKDIVHYSPITRDELFEHGALYELLGRLPILVNYGPLDNDAINIILNRKLEKISSLLGVNVTLERKYKSKLIGASKSSRYGCRIFDQRIFEPAFQAFTEIMEKGKSIEETTIDLNEDGYILLSQESASIETCDMD